MSDGRGIQFPADETGAVGPAGITGPSSGVGPTTTSGAGTPYYAPYIVSTHDLGDRVGTLWSNGTWTYQAKGSAPRDPVLDALTRAQTEAALRNAQGSSSGAAASNYATQERAREFDLQSQADAAKNAADQAHQSAVQALAEGNASEARRQFEISTAETQRWHNLDASLRQQSQQLETAKFGQSVYDKLAELASNPRNYMEQFFRIRGQQPPPGVAQYGNTSVTGPGLPTAEQFIPSYLRSLGLGSYGFSPSAPAPSMQGLLGPHAQTLPGPQQTIPVGPGGAISDWSRAHGYTADASPQGPNPYAGTNTNYGGSPTTADTALIGGVKTWAGGPYSGMAVDKSPANAGDLTPYLQNPNAPDPTGRVAPKAYAGGGSLRMTAPHAIVNLLSGRVAAIAGEQKGRGPHGFVPETAKFSGRAIVDPLGGKAIAEPAPPDGGTTPPLLPDASTDPGVYAPPYDPNAPPRTPIVAPYTGISGPGLPPSLFAPPPSTPDYTTAPGLPPPPQPIAPTQPITPQRTLQLTPEQQAYIASQNAAAAAYNAVQPVPTANATTTITPPPPPPPVTTFTTPSTPVNQWGGPVIQPTTPTVSPSFNAPPFLQNLQNLASTPSGIGKNPVFLPEDIAQQDPIVGSMLQAGTFAPFLQRLYAQARGLPGLGTNTVQSTDLPSGLPLASRLAINQMSPSELAALQSFVSAHGMDWQDYLALVEAASPQGGTSAATAYPKFLGQ